MAKKSMSKSKKKTSNYGKTPVVPKDGTELSVSKAKPMKMPKGKC